MLQCLWGLRDILGADAAGELPVHHLKPGGYGGGRAGQHLGRAVVGEHVKAEWRLECCDNRGFIVRVLSLLSNVICDTYIGAGLGPQLASPWSSPRRKCC